MAKCMNASVNHAVLELGVQSIARQRYYMVSVNPKHDNSKMTGTLPVRQKIYMT